MNTEHRLLVEIDEAESKAWDALSRYKFQMFGYWAAIWVHLNRISGAKRSNPWRGLVVAARVEVSSPEQPPPIEYCDCSDRRPIPECDDQFCASCGFAIAASEAAA
jgi:hypothetical protein